MSKLLDTWADRKGRITVVFIQKVLFDFKLAIGAYFNAVVDYSVDRSGQKYASEALCSWINDGGVVDLT